MLFSSQERRISFGLLVIRVGLAVILLIHSVPRLLGGAVQWKSVGTTLNCLNLGISLEILGFAVSLLESLAAISLLSGYLFRTSCTVMTVIFGFYFFNYLDIGYRTLTLFSLGFASVFIGLINTGPGRYAVAVKLETK